MISNVDSMAAIRKVEMFWRLEIANDLILRKVHLYEGSLRIYGLDIQLISISSEKHIWILWEYVFFFLVCNDTSAVRKKFPKVVKLVSNDWFILYLYDKNLCLLASRQQAHLGLV